MNNKITKTRQWNGHQKEEEISDTIDEIQDKKFVQMSLI
jgi:hypothetical protein